MNYNYNFERSVSNKHVLFCNIKVNKWRLLKKLLMKISEKTLFIIIAIIIWYLRCNYIVMKDHSIKCIIKRTVDMPIVWNMIEYKLFLLF